MLHQSRKYPPPARNTGQGLSFLPAAPVPAFHGRPAPENLTSFTPFASQSADPDRTGLVAFGARQRYRQNAVAAFSGDAVLIDFNRQRDRTVEAALQPLTAMNAGFLRVFD